MEMEILFLIGTGYLEMFYFQKMLMMKAKFVFKSTGHLMKICKMTKMPIGIRWTISTRMEFKNTTDGSTITLNKYMDGGERTEALM